ncbi:uncharacterized protein LOC135333020 [Halichondria panicea]|uniref:uncharacterized protein LOC135333020 n=1 Tax=Halichondria panicea TaxID=6063 RepID=UPI00312BB0B1
MNIDSSSPDEAVPSDTFHIYVLSFAYGALMVMIMVHIVWRWQWRRSELSTLKTHHPGDNSFHCKAMRNCLNRDFSRILELQVSPKARLMNTFERSQFGLFVGDTTVPSDWYRMKAFDAAADFVSECSDCVHKPVDMPYQDVGTVSLPTFLSLLKQDGLLIFEPRVVDRCCELYEFARYRDGNFTESHVTEFISLLTQLKALFPEEGGRGTLSPGPPFSQDPLSMSSLSSDMLIACGKHNPLNQTTSNDPLIGGYGTASESQSELASSTKIQSMAAKSSGLRIGSDSTGTCAFPPTCQETYV